jgi:ATP-binding cassette, subfamily B (MDR/TAP), member 1
VGYGKILFTQADGTDKFLMWSGYFFAVVTGLGIPSFTFLFGDIINDFGTPGSKISDTINPLALQMTIIGGVMFVTSYLYFVFLVIMAERIGKKTRVAYLRSILKQEIAWFDSSVNITELSSLLSKQCQAIQTSLGEKMGQV